MSRCRCRRAVACKSARSSSRCRSTRTSPRWSASFSARGRTTPRAPSAARQPPYDSDDGMS
eukprot:1504920-Prymnesium_polylepis.1